MSLTPEEEARVARLEGFVALAGAELDVLREHFDKRWLSTIWEELRLRTVSAYGGISLEAGRNGVTLGYNYYTDAAGNQYRVDDAYPATQLVVLNEWVIVYGADAGSGQITWAERYRLGSGATWTAPTLAANWTNFGGTYGGAGYRKDNMGRVELKGLVKKGIALALPDALFTLPASPINYRPATDLIINTTSFGGATALNINTAGVVSILTGGSATWTSLAGLSFDPAV